MQKYATHITVLIAVVVLAGSYLVVQGNKQAALDRKERREILRKVDNDMTLEACKTDAEDAFWTFAEMNGTGKRGGVGGVKATKSIWDMAKETRQSAINNCFKQYK